MKLLEKGLMALAYNIFIEPSALRSSNMAMAWRHWAAWAAQALEKVGIPVQPLQEAMEPSEDPSPGVKRVPVIRGANPICLVNQWIDND